MDTIAWLLDRLNREGVRLVPTEEGMLRIEGAPLPKDLRPYAVAAKAQLLAIFCLERRLSLGETLCDAATGTERDRLEDHWLRLLHEYERACDEEIAPPTPAPPLHPTSGATTALTMG